MSSKCIFILNGPNLNLLGQRQVDIYGQDTLDDITQACTDLGAELGLDVEHYQSNHEGALVDLIHQARDAADGIIINAAAYTHTSVAILDALNTFEGPVVELHISQVHKREEFRHLSYIAKRADAVMAGFGTYGYQLAVRHLAQVLD